GRRQEICDSQAGPSVRQVQILHGRRWGRLRSVSDFRGQGRECERLVPSLGREGLRLKSFDTKGASSMKRLFICLLAALVAAGCTPSRARPPRPAVSSLSCMHGAIDTRLPKQAPDKELHCLAAGFIARYCSPTEARIAGAGKEFRDFFTPHESAEWGDW